MVSFCSSQISNRGRFRVFFRKCHNVGNTRAICYDGLKAATILGLEESIKILEPNVPKHPLSTFAQAIFKVCLGRDKEASQVFQLFAAHHADLRSEEVRVFFRKCLSAGNTRAIGYDGLQAATILGLVESIKILEPIVPKHPLSTFAQAIFKVCLGRDKEASQVFQLFAAHHADLRSEEILDLGRSMQYLMPHFYAPWLNTYGETSYFRMMM
ncbi:hypothetical protein F2Q70_00004634 [Brassica cretica]|uniref:Uncharacterized protein n=1 Tax=Brassica cretica TaxID=69181 RepID=A0A8S9IU86_BRACR|nr:hypothetical protein F2Q70_00004634 [Brassica cretica]